MVFLTLFIGAFGLWLASNVNALISNYRTARRSGLPVFITPVNPDHLLWLLFHELLRPYMEAVLPARLLNIIKVTFYGWEFRDKHETHRRVGGAFLLVTPGDNECWVGDPAIAQIILARRRDFVQLPIANRVIGFLGANLLSSDGEAWSRQRRLIAPNLNEKISNVVWQESSKQALQMSSYLLAQPNGETSESVDGLRAIAMNVLGEAGYGQPRTWTIDEQQTSNENAEQQDKEGTLFDAVALMAFFLVPSALLPSVVLKLPFLPDKMKRLGVYRANYPTYVHQLLDKERSSPGNKSEPRNNLVAMLVRLADQGDETGVHDKPSVSGQYLTEDEIRGNIFVFTAAGFDTTANTLAYAVSLLALYPEWQAWIHEELDIVYKDIGRHDECDYDAIFPRLTRCLAFMYEVLRTFTPVVHISRSTAQAQSITTSKGQFVIPGQSKVYINSSALHHDPSVWGDDALDFKPTRWLPKDAKVGEGTPLLTPPRGSFVPWSGGPRVCPGMKMAQVEFVAVISTLFRRATAEPAVNKGESMKMARSHIKRVLDESTPRLTLQMNRPKDIRLKWIAR